MIDNNNGNENTRFIELCTQTEIIAYWNRVYTGNVHCVMVEREYFIISQSNDERKQKKILLKNEIITKMLWIFMCDVRSFCAYILTSWWFAYNCAPKYTLYTVSDTRHSNRAHVIYMKLLVVAYVWESFAENGQPFDIFEMFVLKKMKTKRKQSNDFVSHN